MFQAHFGDVQVLLGIGDVPESGVEVGGVIRHGRLKLRKEGIRNN